MAIQTSATKEHLHSLVEQLPEGELHTALRFLEYLRDTGDPVLRAFMNAPEDDEPLTDEDRAAIEEAKEDLAAGRVMSHEELRRRLLEQP